MGLGRLEFGYPFLSGPKKTVNPAKKDSATRPTVQTTIGRVQHSIGNDGIIPQPLPPRSQVVLVTNADQDPADFDRRGLPTGSSVLLIIDEQFDVRFRNPTETREEAETVAEPARPKRVNPLRETVRLRWRVFHPEYTQKSEFYFDASPSSSSESKRKTTAPVVEHKPKRTRDDDAEPVFSEKPPAIVETEHEPDLAGESSHQIVEEAMDVESETSTVEPDDIEIASSHENDEEESVPEVPIPAEPSTPVMGSADPEAMKVVPWMPLTPPETPLSMGGRGERTIEFALTLPKFMTPPSPTSSLLESPSFFREKEPQSPSYFVPTPPLTPSPHPVLDSPLPIRIHRIRETIKEEEEEEEEDQVEVEGPEVAEEANEDEESDVEEIVRCSPRIDYPSPPQSPMPVTESAEAKGKALSRAPSFTYVYSPSPPPSIRDMCLSEDEGTLTTSSKGKEKETRPSIKHDTSYPSPVLEQEEEHVDDDDNALSRRWVTADDIFANNDPYSYTYHFDNRPPTPASSINSLNRRWSGVSRMSYQTGITTPPATRPGSAIGNHSNKLLSWTESDNQLLRRQDSFASSIRRELFRDQSSTRTRKLIAPVDDGRPALRWSMSMPLIREQWPIRYPTVVPPVQKNYIGSYDDTEEYEVEIPGQIRLLPLTRGVIVTPPRIERRRRLRNTSYPGPHRRKVKSLVVYDIDDQLDGLTKIFGELGQVEDEILMAQRIVEVVEEKQQVSEPALEETLQQQEVVEELKEKKRGLLKRMKTRASGLKEKVKSKMHIHKNDKGKAVAA